MSQKYDICSNLVVNMVVNCSHGLCALPPPHNSNRGSDFLLVVHRNLPVVSGCLEIITERLDHLEMMSRWRRTRSRGHLI